MCSLGFSQFKVNTQGKTLIGPPITTNYDNNNILSAGVFGKGTAASGAKLAFGDFSTLAAGGGNVFIGEYGSGDSDQLWLHGKLGLYFTRNSSSIDIVGYCNSSGSFYFNTTVWASGTLSFDIRFCDNNNVTYSNTSNLPSLTNASNKIQTSGTVIVKSTDNVTFEAGNEVILNGGFEIQLGGTFEINMNECGEK